MTPQKLDFIFPFFMFFYGLMVVLVLENPALVRLGEEKLGTLYQNLAKHKTLGWLCFFLGGLWSAQNVWHTSL